MSSCHGLYRQFYACFQILGLIYEWMNPGFKFWRGAQEVSIQRDRILPKLPVQICFPPPDIGKIVNQNSGISNFHKSFVKIHMIYIQTHSYTNTQKTHI